MVYKRKNNKKPLFNGPAGSNWGNNFKHAWNAGRAVTDEKYRFSPQMWVDAAAATNDQQQNFKKGYTYLQKRYNGRKKRRPVKVVIPKQKSSIMSTVGNSIMKGLGGGTIQKYSKPKTQKREQRAFGDTGNDIETKDSFTKTRSDLKWKNYPLISSKQQIKYDTTGGCLGTQGRANWGFLRREAFATADSAYIASVNNLKYWENLTNLQWMNNNDGASTLPTWQFANDPQQRHFLNRKFLFEKVTQKYCFKNQSSSPIHFEYFIITPSETGPKEDFFRKIRDGIDNISNGFSQYNPTEVVPTSADETRMTSNTNMTIFKSKLASKHFDLVYQHKVRMVEGGTHTFNYTHNANAIINWASLLKADQLTDEVENDSEVVKGITQILVWKIYGDLGDNSKLINTVNVGGITTGDVKIIWRCETNVFVRQVMSTPQNVYDLSTMLPTNLENVYEKDGGTGGVDDIMKEEQ